MSINTVDATNGRLTLQGDYVIHHQDQIEFNLEGDRLPSKLKGTFKGDMFVTNLRLIFLNENSTGYQSFSMGFKHIRNVEVKQPIFGANHLKGFVIAEPNGGWEGNANFKINFPKGGAIEFAEIFQKAVKDSLRNQHNGYAPLPPQQPMFYAPPPGSVPPPPSGSYYYPPPPQQQQFYAYQPGMPSAGQQPVYGAPMGQAPPPYQNETGFQGGYQPPPNGKSHEAYMSGNNAYVPSEAPPPYNPNYNGKKTD